ncbi:uncharacterized protein Bfra_008391 [Botrytis fragariae]|uniref:Uncharacterized protein n=1 Tax=Botrytis fragariae TaxID=1964551 RepID=A0A8H6AT04_9HELO|nr:uncharacterized protein Bfra_008391 [Botrytis fragariae]KAF5873114.1 hypothetical protein Bfra_008391 [Botrytis fragariae]
MPSISFILMNLIFSSQVNDVFSLIHLIVVGLSQERRSLRLLVNQEASTKTSFHQLTCFVCLVS